MKKVIYLLLSIFLLASCSDDIKDIPKIVDNITFDTMEDERDGYVYKTIKIGNQEWLAENLRYRIPQGSAAGCFTYGEATISSSTNVVNKQIFKDSVLLAITNKEIVDPPGLPFMQRPTMLIRLNIDYVTPSQLIEGLAAHPNVVAVLERIYKNLESAGMAEVARQNFIKAEKENDNYFESYGLLYTFEAASNAIPEGWRLPTDEDWKILERALGVPDSEIDDLEAWRGIVSERFTDETVGFNAKYGGGKLYGIFMYGTSFLNKEVNGYYWTSSEYQANDSTTYGISRNIIRNNPGIWRGTAKTTSAFSVRCVR